MDKSRPGNQQNSGHGLLQQAAVRKENGMKRQEVKSDQTGKTGKTIPGILNRKWYLYLTEFFAGMAVMAVELGASRLLAPYFSSSQIVWTIIIGTIMIAMALGNVWGGRMADRYREPDRLYRRMIIAAAWIAAIPVLGKYIIVGITGVLVIAVNTNFLIWAAFLACMIIFVYPLFLLGTVTPSLVKFSTDSLDNNGRVVGTLGACNTVGSIIGTFLPTFVTIPAVGTAVTFLLFSGILMAIGIIYFLSARRGFRSVVIGAVIFVLCSIFGSSDSFAFWEKNLTYEGESVYNYLQVRDSENSTILSTNVLFGVQSIKMKNDELTGLYYDYALAAPVMAGAEQKKTEMLVLGMGTGTFAQQSRKFFPKTEVEGVEIDQKITDLAHRYFDLPKSVPVATYDGRAYLHAQRKKYDVIMVDAYQDITIPFQMSSREFFSEVRQHLKKDGVMVVNMNMHSEQKDNINEYLEDTIASVFPTVYTVNVTGSTNRELFATEDPDLLKKFNQNRTEIQDVRLAAMMSEVSEGLNVYHGGTDIFTDDKAPVELLGMREIDGLIQDEIGYYKDIFRERGLRGLIEQISD